MSQEEKIPSKDIIQSGLWGNNPALVQLLGLCPLLAVSNTFINGLALGLATTCVLAGSNASVSLVRNYIPKEIRIPIFVMMIASFVTNVGLLMNAYTYDLFLTLGIFIPLIVTNCAIIGRAEAFASKNKFLPSLLDGVMQGIGFTLVLCTLGALRELVGQGTLFYGAEQLLGDWASSLTLSFYLTDSKFLFAILPPGAFVFLGLLIAGKNYIDKRNEEKSKTQILEKTSSPVEVIASEQN